MTEHMPYDEISESDEIINKTSVSSPEETPEHIPTPEEVHGVFQRLVGEGKEYEVTKSIDDEKGLYELEIKIPGELAGETTGYEYRRFPAPRAPEIHVTYYEDGDYIHGTSAARYVNGEWKIL